MASQSHLIKLLVIMSNVDMRLLTNQFLSKKPWAFVQNVLGFEVLRTMLSDEKFEVIFTDGGEGSGGIEAFVKQVRESKRNASTLVICMQKDAVSLDEVLSNDSNFRFWPWPLSMSNIDQLAIEIAEARLKPAPARTPAAPKGFDARLLNAVLDATRDVLGFYFSSEIIDFGKPNYRKQPLAERSGLTGLITIAGDKFEGSMALAASLDFLQKLGCKMFPEQDYKLSKEGSIDMIAELSNQLIGRIKMRFGDLGLTSHIGLPEVMMGKNHAVPHKIMDTAIFLALKVDNAICEIELTIKQQTDFIIDETKALQSVKDVIMFD